MGTAFLLKRLLTSLCQDDSFWKYAVFWKIKRPNLNQTLLAWEDGYCKPAASAGATAVSNEIFAGTSRIISFGSKVNAPNVHPPGCSIEQAIASMSSHSYTFGDGIIGHVSFTGRHFWIFANSRSFSQYPEEWQLQVAGGIKTIVLVPVQFGVVQLGSLVTVEENLTMVAHIKRLFASIQDTIDSYPHFAPSGNIMNALESNIGLPIELHSNPMKKNVKMGFYAESDAKKEESDIDHHLSTSYITQETLPFPQVDMQHIFGMSLDPQIDENSWISENDPTSVVSPQNLGIFDSCYGSNNSFLIDSPNCSFEPERILLAPLQCHDDEQILLNEQSMFINSYDTELRRENYNSFGSGVEIDCSFATESSDIILRDSPSNMLNFSTELNLHEASGLPSRNDVNNDLLVFGIHADGLDNNLVAYQTEDDNNFKYLLADFSELPVDQNNEKQLLDAVITKSRSSSDEIAQNISRCTRSPSNSSENLVSSCVTHHKIDTDFFEADNLDSRHHAKNNFALGTEAFTSSPTCSPSRSGSLLTNEVKQTKNPRYESNSIKKSRQPFKKSKTGGPRKPRPRDRQLIQDRVKELRELVPHGEKCSIDSLLDRAIKHMMFLKSVSSQAEKLGDCAHQKVLHENQTSAEIHHDDNEATWTYELDSKPEICPIVVENLEKPGHMLVEMLCKEYGDFLEIAHVIRHSELVILKGVMESRSDKLWARFVVEVSRGFDRMDILWPLMRLMQQIRGPFTASF